MELNDFKTNGNSKKEFNQKEFQGIGAELERTELTQSLLVSLRFPSSPSCVGVWSLSTLYDFICCKLYCYLVAKIYIGDDPNKLKVSTWPQLTVFSYGYRDFGVGV